MKKILGLVVGLLFTLPSFATDLDLCRNLFDGQIEQGGISHANGTLAPSSTKRLYSVNFIDIQPNTSYALSAVVTEKIKQGMIFFYDNNENFIGMGSNNWVNLPFSATSPANAYKARFVLTQSDEGTILTPSDAQNVQFEQGSTATEYSAYCPPIKVATKKYNDTAFSPVVTALNSAISTIKTVVTNTINQAAAVSALQTGKQTMPNASATNGTCPNFRQCLLVEGADGTPQWFVITDPFRDFVAPILATNTNGTSSTNDPGYQQVEYFTVAQNAKIELPHQDLTNNFNVEFKVRFTDGEVQYTPLLVTMRSNNAWFGGYKTTKMALREYSGTDYVMVNKPAQDRDVTVNFVNNNGAGAIYYDGVLQGTSSKTVSLLSDAAYPTFMFSDNISPSSGNNFIGRFYYMKINDELYLPVLRKSDSKIGVYNVQTGAFYPNAGEGTFTAGPNVTNDANVPSGPNWSVTWSDNGNSESGTVYGEGVCNAVAGTNAVAATSANLSASGWGQSGASCWCKTTGATVNQESSSVSSAPWVFFYTHGSAADCVYGCAYYCARNVRDNASFRTAIFNTGS